MNVTIFKTMAGVVFKSTEFKLSKAPALSAYLLWSLSLGFLNTYKKKKKIGVGIPALVMSRMMGVLLDKGPNLGLWYEAQLLR